MYRIHGEGAAAIAGGHGSRLQAGTRGRLADDLLPAGAVGIGGVLIRDLRLARRGQQGIEGKVDALGRQPSGAGWEG